jgi:hypothetical protein
MLSKVLHEIERTDGTLNISDLQRKLGVERSALEGMMQFLVQTGRLVDGDASIEECDTNTGSCGPICTGLVECAFVAKMPKTYKLPKKN